MRALAVRRRVVRDDGTAMIEFALVLPILLLLVFGIIDFGFLFRQQMILTNAAREGARMAVLPGYSTADIIDRVKKYVDAGGLNKDDVTVTPTLSPMTPPAGPSFTVYQVDATMPYTYPFVGPITALFGERFATVTLRGRAVMRTEFATAP